MTEATRKPLCCQSWRVTSVTDLGDAEVIAATIICYTNNKAKKKEEAPPDSQSKRRFIPYEDTGNFITPVTIHAATRKQIRFRLITGRYTIND